MAVTVRLIAALMLCGAFAFPARAETTGTAASEQDEEGPTPAPLMVGALAIASDADLAIQRMALDVSVDRVTYTYGFQNKGKNELKLATSVSMPDLEVNTEGTTTYNLPSNVAENPVGPRRDGRRGARRHDSLDAGAGAWRRPPRRPEGRQPPAPAPSAPRQTRRSPGQHPRRSPSSSNSASSPPRDQAEPDTPLLADWTLHTVHSWMQTLPAGATTEVKVSFQPVKAVYGVRADGLPGFEALKDQVCLTPQILAAAKALLKAKDNQLEVDDLTLANDGPARWLDNPPGTVSVTKPKPDSVVAFCGMNAATAGQPVVQGKLPGSADAPGLRVLIFSKGVAVVLLPLVGEGLIKNLMCSSIRRTHCFPSASRAACRAGTRCRRRCPSG